MIAADFPDWLSPVLVKELRQGLRTKVFISSFLLLQIAMVILTGMRLMSPDFIQQSFDYMFWFVLGLVLLLIMPSRASALVQEERKQNTFELLQMTHLPSLRIVVGKWLSVVSLAALVLVGVLPYLVLRYFFGGMDVEGSLSMLGGLMLGCCLLAALSLYSSCLGQNSVNGSWLILMLVYLVCQMVVAVTGWGARGIEGTSAVFLAAAYTGYFLLQGAAKIAPAAEDPTVCIRAYTWGVWALGFLGWWWTGNVVWFLGALPLVAWTCLQAVTSLTSIHPANYAYGARRGLPGLLLNRVLTPGWATGVPYVMLTWLFGFVAHWSQLGATPKLGEYLTLCLTLPAVLFPLALFQLAGWRVLPPLWYLLVQAICFGLCFVPMIGSWLPGSAPAWQGYLASVTPLTAIASNMNDVVRYDGVHLHLLYTMVVPIGALTLLICGWGARRDFRLIARLEQSVISDSSVA
jgi:ABC-type transport system involved in multi-copper enzyme maturation permease subunit